MTSRINFRDTGYKRPSQTKTQSAGAANTLVSSPGAGKQIVIYDIVVAGSDGTQIIRDAAAGIAKIYLPDGHIGFSSPFPMGEDKLIRIEKSGSSTTTFAVTVNYSIEDV